ncbi:MAG: two-component system response regulator CpxR [Glaciecola sp.]|jgi:two-component system response regulator CpxR
MSKILIIEDDPDVTVLLREILRLEGWDVEVAADGLSGLVKLQSAAADVTLLDIMMPDVDGERVLAQLLEEGGGTLAKPVLVITGSPSGADRCRTLIGSRNVFEKPFDPELLTARIWSVLRGDA